MKHLRAPLVIAALATLVAVPLVTSMSSRPEPGAPSDKTPRSVRRSPRHRSESARSFTGRVQQTFVERVSEVFGGAVEVRATEDGLEMRNPFPAAAETPGDEPNPVSPEEWAREVAARFHLTLPTDGADPITMHMTPTSTLRVTEDGTSGAAERLDGTVSYARGDGRVYWTGRENGFEEWLALDRGVAYRERAVATWRVEGGRPLVHGEGVRIVDANGSPRMHVSADRAYRTDGTQVPTELRVEGDRIALYVDANGDEVLVDPMWRPTGAMVVPRYGHATVSIAGGVFAVGGQGRGTNAYLASAETYDDYLETWSATVNGSGVARRAAIVVPFRDNNIDKILVAGGLGTGAVHLNQSAVYDVDTRTFTVGPNPMVVARANTSGVALPDGRILVPGGSTAAATADARAEIYDPASYTWAATGSLSGARSRPQVVYVDFYSTAYVIGGYAASGNTRASVEMYSEALGTFSNTANMNSTRGDFSAMLLGNSEILVSGGVVVPGNTFLSSAEIFNPQGAGTWTPIAPMNAVRVSHTLLEYFGGNANGIAWAVSGATPEYLTVSAGGTYAWTWGPPMADVHPGGGVALTGLDVLVSGGSSGSMTVDSERLSVGCNYDNGGCSFNTSCSETATSITCGACPAGTKSPSGNGSTTCTSCPSGTYASGTGNTTCTPKTDCAPGSFVLLDGGRTADRTCDWCIYGTNFSTTTNAGSCTGVTTCVPGTRQQTGPTISSDRVCAACTTGFTTTNNATSCTAWRNCFQGTFVSAAPTPTTNRVCSNCPAETFSTAMNVTACTPATVCGPGQRMSQMLYSGIDRLCENCGAGTFTAANNQPSCSSWSTCSAGTYVSNTPSTSEDRMCTTCADGSFSTGADAPACTAWATCAAGTYVSNTPSTSEDRTCTTCGPDTYSSTENVNGCGAVSTCTPGTYVTAPPTSASDRECTACAGGTFSSADNATGCTTYSDCGAGSYVTTEPSASNDRVCQGCDGSSYSAGTNPSMCTACTTCGIGETATSSCTSTTDTVCIPIGSDAGVGNPDAGTGAPDAGGSPDAGDVSDSGSPDAAVEPTPAASEGGCSCRVGPGSPAGLDPLPATLAALVLLTLAHRARRRDRPRA